MTAFDTAPPLPSRQARDWRWYEYAPLIGWIARDVRHEGPETFYYALVIALTVLVLCVKTWGLVALVLAALAMVPVMFVILLRITVGK